MILRRRTNGDTDHEDQVEANPASNTLLKKKRKPPKLPKVNRRYFKIKPFIEEYLIDFNGVKAYHRSGFGNPDCKMGDPDYRRDTQAASKILSKPQVIQAIHEAVETRARKVPDVTPEKIIKELSLLAFSNIKDYITWDIDGTTTMKPSEQLTNDQAACIAELVEVSSSKYRNTIKFKLYEKKGALIDLGKHLGMFWEDSGRGSNPLEEAKKIQQALREIEGKIETKPGKN